MKLIQKNYDISPLEFPNNLKYLDLSSNKLSSIPESILKFKLSTLNLSKNHISDATKLCENHSKLENITQLHISNNHLTKLSLPFSLLNKLKVFECKVLSEATEFIENSKCNLSSLSLNNNFMSILHIDSILLNLRTLCIRNAQLTQIPQQIFKIASLNNLDLSMNNITSIPPAIKGLTNLKEVDLSDNQITHGFNELDNLEMINLSRNHHLVVNRFYGFSKLRNLNLSQCSLKAIPKFIYSTINLEVLNLKLNLFKEVSRFISSLNNLKRLDLSCNRLTMIPDSISELKILTNLNIYSCGLYELQKALESCYVWKH